MPVPNAGELVAKYYLIEKEYKILHQNWTCRWGELDIIAKKDSKLVFVEVKYRTSTKFGRGYESVGYHKLTALTRAIQTYLVKTNNTSAPWQLDVIDIIKVGESHQLEHFESVHLV